MGGFKPSPPAQLRLELHGTALVQEAREKMLTRAGGGGRGRTRGHLASRLERSMALSSPHTGSPIKAKSPLPGTPRARHTAPFSLHRTALRHSGTSRELPAHATTPGTGQDGTPTCPALPLGRVLEGSRSGWERDRRKERGAGCQPSSWTRSRLSAPRKTRSNRGREETGEAATVFEPLRL